MKNHLLIARLALLTLPVVMIGCHKAVSDSRQQSYAPIESDSLLLISSDSPAAPMAPFPQFPLT